MTEILDWNYDGLPRYVAALQEWLNPELRLAHHTAVLPDGTNRLCLGVLVYGNYIDRFLRLCVPSLLAPGNIRALSDPLMIVHTDAANVERLRVGLAALAEVARVEIHTVAQAVIDLVPENPANKYWLLGAAHNLHMQQAKYRGHSYHMLMPDHVYATGFFAGLVRLRDRGARAIVQGGLSVKLEALAPIVKRAWGAIPPERLIQLALNHLHPQVGPFLVNGRHDLPASLLLVMVGHRSVHIVSPHMSIVYLSHDVLMRAPLRLFNTIDGQLPFLIPNDVEPVVPSPDDGMVYVEVSDADKADHWGNEGCTLEQFCARFWVLMYCVRAFERYFALTTELKFSAGHTPPMTPMADDEIAALQHHVRCAVTNSYHAIYALLPERLRIDPIEWSRRHPA